MSNEWNDATPIYKQLEAQLVSWILNGKFQEGDALPSIRKLSVEFQINHLTVAKSLQNLVDQGVVEKRRGLGMFITTGAVSMLNKHEKTKFFEEEIPHLAKRLNELNISVEELREALNSTEHLT